MFSVSWLRFGNVNIQTRDEARVRSKRQDAWHVGWSVVNHLCLVHPINPNNNKSIKMSVDEMEGVVHEVDTSEDIRANFQLLERAVAQFDNRFTLRAIRAISSLRKKLPDTKIAALDVKKKPAKEILAEAEQLLAKNGQAKKEAVPEVEIYIGILIQVSHFSLLPRLQC
jgi:hypothetical protein